MFRALRRRSLRTILGVTALIAAIFIAESFTTLMGMVIDNGGSVWRLMTLLTFKLPEIVDFALPFALMLGLYFALTGARDDNELVICAAAGSRWTAVPAFALIVGAIGFCISLSFSAVISPSAAYMMRVSNYDMKMRALVDKISGETEADFIRTYQDRTVIAKPPEDPTKTRGNLYLFYEGDDETWQFDQAEAWDVVGRDADEGVRVELQGFRTYSGAPPGVEAVRPRAAEQSGLGMVVGPANIQVSNVTVTLRRDELLPVLNRDRRPREVLYLGLTWASGEGIAGGLSEPTGRLGAALARAVLCPFAALVAIVGAVFAGTGIGRFTALPVTTGAILGADLLSRAILQDAGRTGDALYFWSFTGLWAATAIALPLSYIVIRGERILVPRRGRA